MSIQIRRLTLQDYEQAIDFLNLVFSQDHCPHEFRNLLPNWYLPTEACMSCQCALLEDGRIRAMVGAFPREFEVAGHRLTDVGIGNVAVHRDHRGKGYMQVLMKQVGQDMADSGAHMSLLGGYRERYRHFGYEMAGCSHRFTFSRFSMQHLARRERWPAYTFVPLAEGEALEKALALHDAQPFRCLRPAESFLTLCRSWNARPMAILGEDGAFAGYLVLNQAGNGVTEILLKDDAALPAVVFSLLGERGLDSLSLSLGTHQRGLLALAYDRCENMELSPAGRLKVIRPAPVFTALLALKASWTPLMDGSRVLDTALGTFRVTVSGGVPLVEPTTDRADITLPGFDVYRVVLGLLPDPTSDPLLNNWFPVPYSVSMPDHV